ncbi:hypothetical protein C9374_012452 [Naegleria lovaniensis]|uniref:Extradiol ring-cleavage dioxygenase class III enzyme subunit B domain-containing protein n=1 Tax=Naegleria lovaniensis TaxID=51637 RepID=A0AA88KVY7_NAELO|nr:uncharacterized protein C9374_012452 [Naegleria lovaniensis]KAG2392200.1 hypothetical protein C9374_012452 [Naegleria lovaniensis]
MKKQTSFLPGLSIRIPSSSKLLLLDTLLSIIVFVSILSSSSVATPRFRNHQPHQHKRSVIGIDTNTYLTNDYTMTTTQQSSSSSVPSQPQGERIRAMFIGHGSPTLCIEPHHAMNQLLSNKVASQFKNKPPKAVVVFTAHWEAHPHVSITFHDSSSTYETIHDFYGFPREMYEIEYPAKGAPQVAARIEQLLQQQSIPTRRELKRGLDHGTWVLLKALFPQANIPVVQCSIDERSSVEHHYKIGKALAPLAYEEVLVIGSGATVHNLGRLSWGKNTPEQWAMDFDQFLIDNIAKWNTESLFKYDKLAPYAKQAVPRSEHFVPLFVAMGMADETKKGDVLERFYDFGSLSYLSFEF